MPKACGVILALLLVPFPAGGQEGREVEPLVSLLEGRFRALTSVQAEYSLEKDSDTEEDDERPRFIIWSDFGKKKALLGMRETEKTPDVTWVASMEKMTAVFQGDDGKASRMDLGRVIDLLEAPLADIERTSARLRGVDLPEEGFSKRWRRMARILLVFMFRGDEETKPGYFRVVVGWTRRGGASWFNEIRRGTVGAVEETKEEVTFKLTSPPQTIALDRETGFVRFWELENDDKTKSRVRLVDLERDPPAPEVELPREAPERGAPVEMWGHVSRSLWRPAAQWRECLKKGETLDKDAELLQSLLTKIGAYTLQVRSLASHAFWLDQWVGFRLNQGSTIDGIRGRSLLEVARFKAWVNPAVARMEAELREDVTGLTEELVRGLPEEWTPELRKRIEAHIRKALDYGRVAERFKMIEKPSFVTQLDEALKRASKP